MCLSACGSSEGEPGSTATSGGEGGQGSTTVGSGGSDATTGSGGGSAACQPSFDDTTIHLAAGTTVAPGQETTLCLRWTTPEALDISAFVGKLGPGGHHTLLLARSDSKDPDGLAPCSEIELMDAQSKGTFQMLAGVSYESDGIPFTFPSAPVQVGLSVPAGTQLIFDTHFLNTGASPMEGCSTLDLSRGKPVVAKLQFRTVLPKEQYGLTIPAHGKVDVSYEEPIGGKWRVAAASSHMHQGGTHFRMSVKETDQTIYESTQWAEPPPAIFDKTKLILEADQTFKIDCSFENTTDKTQTFPTQMCVGGMYLLSCALPGAC